MTVKYAIAVSLKYSEAKAVMEISRVPSDAGEMLFCRVTLNKAL